MGEYAARDRVIGSLQQQRKVFDMLRIILQGRECADAVESRQLLPKHEGHSDVAALDVLRCQRMAFHDEEAGDDVWHRVGNDVGRRAGAVDDDGQWEDFTCATPWEDFVRSLEDVLREWKLCNTDMANVDVLPRPGVLAPPSSSSPQLTVKSYSKSLEHEGQLFSLQLVPQSPGVPSLHQHTSEHARNDYTSAPPGTRANVTDPRSSASAACELENRRLDFVCEERENATGTSRSPTITPLQRWFGLKQYVLVRALGQTGASGMDVDQLLWATTVASSNCKCSVPVLVSCDWDGLNSEKPVRGGGGQVGRGASCKGYSAPGAAGVACSVRFLTAWTDKPPSKCLYFDGLKDLFISKVRETNRSQGSAVSPFVSTSVQQGWEWTKPVTDIALMPAPALFLSSREDTSDASAKKGNGFDIAGEAVEVNPEGKAALDGMGNPVQELGAGTMFARGGIGARRDGGGFSDVGGRELSKRKRDNAVQQLLSDVRGGGEEAAPLWGPDEDPLVSLLVRVRWTDMREGSLEESEHFTTLDPLRDAEDIRSAFAGEGVESSGAKWFVSPRWRQSGIVGFDSSSSSTSTGDSTKRGENGRLGEACCRLLAAVVQTTTMHPGTLMADLGAMQGSDSPIALAEEYGKAAAVMLSGEARAAVEKSSSKPRPTSIDHDKIDLVLRHLLHPKGGDRVTGNAPVSPASVSNFANRRHDVRRNNGKDVTGVQGEVGSDVSTPEGRKSEWRLVYPGDASSDRDSGNFKNAEGGHKSEWRVAYPRGQSRHASSTGGGNGEDGRAVRRAENVGSSETRSQSREGAGCERSGWSSDGDTQDTGGNGRDESLWVWASKGGAPIGRLLSLLSLRVADCDDLGSMSLLWMSFVRDVRLLWEDGATIARMHPLPELDGSSMFDEGVDCTGQSRSVAAQLRGRHLVDACPCRGGLDGAALGRDGEGVGGDNAGSETSDGRRRLCSPDMRMCLIWQKLQMLNCCCAVIDASIPAKDASSMEEEHSEAIEGGECAGEDEEDDTMFFDTQEFIEASDDGNILGEDDGDVDNDERGGTAASSDGDLAHDVGDDSGIHLPSEGDFLSDLLPHSGVGPSTADDVAVVSPASTTAQAEVAVSATSTTAVAAGDDPQDKTRAVPSDQGGEAPEGKSGSERGHDGDRDDHGAASGDSVDVDPISASKSAAYSATTRGEASPCTHAAVSEASEVGNAPAFDGKAEDRIEVAGASAADPDDHDGAVAEDVPEGEERSGMHGEGGVDTTSAAATEGEAVAAAESPAAVGESEEEARQSDDVTSSMSGPSAEVVAEGSADIAVAHDKEHPETNTSTKSIYPEAQEVPSSRRSSEACEGAPAHGRSSSDDSGDPGRSSEAHPSADGAANSTAIYPEGASTITAVETDKLRLLRSREVVRCPRLQPSGPVTSDMLEVQQLGQAAAYRGREVLVTDMEAFRSENEGAVFADFVRWYRPECWQAFESSTGASYAREDAGEQDDRRLAWLGQGQVLWRGPEQADSQRADTGPAADSIGPPSAVTLAGWLSCWGESAAQKSSDRVSRSLFSSVKEGEKALHYLETISPGPLLVQLLSALMGLSVFVLEQASTHAGDMPAAKDAANTAKLKVAEAVELLAAISVEEGGTEEAVAGNAEDSTNTRRGTTPQGGDGSSSSPFRVALLAADAACLAVKKAEAAISRAVSLQRSLPGQAELVNAIVACTETGGEALVQHSSQKEFLRDLLVVQGVIKSPRSELEDLLASYDEEDTRRKDDGGRENDGGMDGNTGSSSGMPPPQTKEYVLRCQTPAPFYSRNIKREQMDAYPTPPSRMYANTDGRHLRVAFSLCESDI